MGFRAPPTHSVSGRNREHVPVSMVAFVAQVGSVVDVSGVFHILENKKFFGGAQVTGFFAGAVNCALFQYFPLNFGLSNFSCFIFI